MLVTVLVIVVTLLLSAFFSGMEIAFTSSNRLKTEIDKKKNHTFARVMGVFARRQGQYITTILVGNNIVLVVYSLGMSALLALLAHRWGWGLPGGSVLLNTLISTVVIIFLGEYIPKAIFKSNPNFFMRLFCVPVYFFYVLLYPLARLVTWISVSLLRLLGLRVRRDRQMQPFTRVDLEHLLENVMEHEGDGTKEKTENEFRIFQNALDFPDLRVRDCMVPRVDMEAVEAGAPIGLLRERFEKSQYSRIFVYEGSIDNVVGYVNSKSLFRAPQTIREVLKEVNYVPGSMPAQKLLTGFIRDKQSVAVVIDEFGGTAGMVSLEDMLEEIFGEIEDEHDSQDMTEKQLSEHEYVLSCRLEIEYLNEKYDLGIAESDEYDTLAGWIIFHYEGIPPQGERLVIDDKEVRILRKNGSRLELARIRVME